ncbi:MAG: SprT-like domain-containing protein [Pirellulales bacterium]|jgi:SprT protein|nr:SprT-like domain-containing protein [Pirellulales bacterium]
MARMPASSSPADSRAPATGAAISRLVADHLPAGAGGYVDDLVARLPLEVRLSRPRRTKLGDHRPPDRGRAFHRITINDNLNPYAFLTTLLHEIAHAATWDRHRGRRRLRPHGPEWKAEFGGILRPVVEGAVLPAAVTAALARSLESPAAATCTDRGLVLALAAFDAPVTGRVRVEALTETSFFRTDAGMIFRAGRMIRSRRACFEHPGGREYRVHGLALVEPIEPPPPAGRQRRARPGPGRRG